MSPSTGAITVNKDIRVCVEETQMSCGWYSSEVAQQELMNILHHSKKLQLNILSFLLLTNYFIKTQQTLLDKLNA